MEGKQMTVIRWLWNQGLLVPVMGLVGHAEYVLMRGSR
jgi:hypothetical protein